MSDPIYFQGALASHPRGNVLREILSGQAASAMPPGGGTVLLFATDFQSASDDEQSSFVSWTREPGRLLLLVPPFVAAHCTRPVRWSVERLASPPRGGDGLAKFLARQVTHRLQGQLQTSFIADSQWTDLSVSTAAFRAHPASGLFVVTCLPIWSLTILDVPDLLSAWLTSMRTAAGVTRDEPAVATPTVNAEHLGMLVFLLSYDFDGEEDALRKLEESRIFSVPQARARKLLDELRAQKLVAGTTPSSDAADLVARSAYAPYLKALREGSR